MMSPVHREAPRVRTISRALPPPNTGSRCRLVFFSLVELGEGQVIPGWDEGIATMQVGGTRNLVIPYALGYGEEGAGSTIPPRSTLNFECKLLGVEKSTALKEATMLLGRFGFGANPFTFVFSLFLLTFVIPTETLQQLGLK